MSVRDVLALAIPVMASGVLQALFRPIDQYFVQDLGAAAQGALGATTLVSIFLFALMQIISAGVAAFVGRTTGSGEVEERRRIVERAFGACALLSVGFATFGCFGTESLVDLLGLTGDGAAHAVLYLKVLLIAGAALVFAPTVDAAFHAMGDTKLPLLLQVGAVSLNMVLTPMWVPSIGVAGAALGTCVAQGIATLVGGMVLARRLELTWSGMRPDRSVLPMLRVGLPVGLASMMFAGVYWAMMATTLSELGQDVYAGLGLGFGVLESVAWPMYAGLAVAASSLVSRLLGAGRPDEAVRAVRLCMVPAVIVGGCMTMVYLFLGTNIMEAFAEDPASFREGVRYAMILGWAQPLVAIEAVSEGVLAGAGDTKKLFWTNVPLNLVRVPLAWWFAISLGFGASGLWWAINCSTVVKSTAKLAWVLHGGWRFVSLGVGDRQAG